MIERRLVTAAVAQLLATVAGMPVGLSAAPLGKEPPYYVLTTVSAVRSGPELADENPDLSIVYQVTAVTGPTASVPGSYGMTDQAEWMADKACTAFLARDPNTGLWLHPLPVNGARCYARSLDISPGGSSDAPDAIISDVQRFRFDLTPA